MSNKIKRKKRHIDARIKLNERALNWAMMWVMRGKSIDDLKHASWFPFEWENQTESNRNQTNWSNYIWFFFRSFFFLLSIRYHKFNVNKSSGELVSQSALLSEPIYYCVWSFDCSCLRYIFRISFFFVPFHFVSSFLSSLEFQTRWQGIRLTTYYVHSKLPEFRLLHL